MHDSLNEPSWLRWALIALAVGVMGLLVVMPLLMVLGAAFAEGIGVWLAALNEPDARSALTLTLVTAAIVIPVNAIFGVITAWAVTRFEFRGKRVLLALIDLPFAVSPVVAGLCLVLLFGSQGWFAALLAQHDIKILFARPGIVLATLFITFPFVVRELIPLMQQQGSDEELAARSLGAGAWTMFRRVTLPNIKWGLLYGVLLCGARARDGRVRRGVGGVGPHPRPDQHPAAAHRDPLQRVRQHRGVRGRVAADRARPVGCTRPAHAGARQHPRAEAAAVSGVSGVMRPRLRDGSYLSLRGRGRPEGPGEGDGGAVESQINVTGPEATKQQLDMACSQRLEA